MPARQFYEMEIIWSLMTPMEQSLWGTVLALHIGDEDGGLDTADAAVTRLRELADVRSHQPEPEYEAARANCFMELSEFSAWYPIAYRIRHPSGREYRVPSEVEVKEAYERYARCRCDYY